MSPKPHRNNPPPIKRPGVHPDTNVIDITPVLQWQREDDEAQAEIERIALIEKLSPKAKARRTLALLRQVTEAAEVALHNPLDDFDHENLKHLLDQAEEHLEALGALNAMPRGGLEPPHSFE